MGRRTSASDTAASASGLLAICLSFAGCTRAASPEYDVAGQVLAVDRGRQEITLKHGDIRGFMPGMTMAFKVRPEGLLEGRMPGELVRARLVVEDTAAHLRSIERTGFAPLSPAPPTRVMELAERGQTVRDAVLVDETNTRRQLQDWRGQVIAVTFGYTRCPLPDFCPLIDRHFKAAQAQVREDAALRGGVRLLSVSFDPDHDTPEVLARRAAALGADPAVWQFLTGTRTEVERVASQFGVSVMRGNAPADEIVHNLRTAVIDAHGRLVTVLSGSEWTTADLLAELKNAQHAGR